MPKSYMVGNWKMNQTLSEIEDFFSKLKLTSNQNNFWIAPQAVHISTCINLAMKAGVLIGAQNCSANEFGAYTGESAIDSLTELGCHFSIIGHSERRSLYGESNENINKKVLACIKKGLVPILCIGETLSQRENGETKDVVLFQLEQGLKDVELNNESELIIAYEPVWAIGTGKSASSAQAEEVHQQIRRLLNDKFGATGDEISILYGGSVKPTNVEELLSMPNVNGGLVGGASLKADSFAALCDACSK